MKFGGGQYSAREIILCGVDGGSEGARLDHLVGGVGVFRWMSMWHYNLHIEWHILFC